MSIKKHIPNSITAMNLLSGVIAVTFTFEGRLDIAFYLMLLAAVFDFCDGLCARLLHAYSDIGKELDSLCDMVSFGVLPAVMLHVLMRMNEMDCWLCWVPLSIAVFSALRLAKFNIDERQGSSFLGLATPACAIICASLACLALKAPDFWLVAFFLENCSAIPVLALILSALLVSEIPMFAMKIAPGHSIFDAPRVIFLVWAIFALVAPLVFGLHWSLFPLLLFLGYIVENCVLAVIKR